MPVANRKWEWHNSQKTSAPVAGPKYQVFYPPIFDQTRYHPFETPTTRRKAVIQSITNFQLKSSWLTKLSDRTASIAWLDREIEILILGYGTDAREKAEEERRKKENEPVWMPVEDVYDVLIGLKEYILQLREEGVSIEPDPTAVSVWRKDDVLDQETRGALIDAVTILKNTPYEARGWGPLIANSKAIDLLDPFMYPIIYHQTLSSSPFSSFSSSLNPSPFQLVRTPDLPPYCSNPTDGGSCWLPTDFQILPDGKTNILSYINNLTLPGQAELFHPIFEEIFTKVVPLFNHVLADLLRAPWMEGWRPPGSYEGKRRDLADKWMWTRPEILDHNRLEGKVAKVVTRLVNIEAEASGEGDGYVGNDDTRCLDWHFDGAANELVIATVIYNCTPQTTTSSSSPSIPPNLHLRRRHPISSYGHRFKSNFISEPISIKQNTAIAFPNTYEHRLSTTSHPSTLLLFHLLDPLHPSPPPSTTTIPPQQQSQYLHADLLRKSKIGTLLPEEIFQQILEYTQGNVISPEDAVHNRKLFIGRRESQRDDIIRQY
ncbi:hypothetical protein TWF788_002554 [Orbilia oligospora]|uniref:DUF4246 domain-containing protein n=1 Tax=Orbilia oligospora TaxID=2813651 RepID=A0A7C8P6M6_ORBOL|nr:hypothetical protein TWF788_002554 [Orbilia oligospora]